MCLYKLNRLGHLPPTKETRLEQHLEKEQCDEAVLWLPKHINKLKTDTQRSSELTSHAIGKRSVCNQRYKDTILSAVD
jgi:agmatine/peptidylarginine deiminase